MLRPKLSLLQSISLNMSMMVGIGPFITIPMFVATLGGPHAMIGWLLGAMVALADGLVWSELAAAFPGSGGTYHFFDAVYGNLRIGRMLKFLFVWQFLFSGPLEVATGAIGLAQHAGFLWPVLKQSAWDVSVTLPYLGRVAWHVKYLQLGAMGVMAAITALAYRRIEVAGRVMVVLWVGMLITVAWVIAAGFAHFNPAIAFDVPEGAWTLNRSFALGLGGALGIAMYDFFGYYQICYLGDEVAHPSRTIPRSIIISVLVISCVYLAMNMSILGVLPWQAVVRSDHVAADMMVHLYGSGAANLLTLFVIWTALASTFAALLGYSRVPYASARAGHFFQGLAKTHPKGDFPHRSLLLISALSAAACLADLETVIAALLASRILIQFPGQIATVFYLRTRRDLLQKMPFRMRFFPIPALFALAGWLYVFRTTSFESRTYGVGSLVLGLVVFLAWDQRAVRESVDRPVSDAPAA